MGAEGGLFEKLLLSLYFCCYFSKYSICSSICYLSSDSPSRCTITSWDEQVSEERGGYSLAGSPRHCFQTQIANIAWSREGMGTNERQFF